MENKDAILTALSEFGENPRADIPPALEQYLVHIAKSGETIFPWPKLQPLFVQKLDNVMKKFNEDCPTENLPASKNSEKVQFDEMRTRLITQLNSFSGAPFTIQRLCELVTEPKKQYKRTDKFLRGIERNILVVSTVDPKGKKIVREDPGKQTLVNGMDVNGGGSEESGSTFSTPHTWVTGSSSWQSMEEGGDSDVSAESPSKKPRLSTEIDSKSDTPTSQSGTDLSDSSSTECIASTSNTDTSSEDTEQPTSSTTTATSSSSTNDSLPEQSPAATTSTQQDSSHDSSTDQGDISQSEPMSDSDPNVSQSKLSAEDSSASSEPNEAVSSSNNGTESATGDFNQAPSESGRAQPVISEDSMGFDTADLKANSSLVDTDSAMSGQSEEVDSTKATPGTTEQSGVAEETAGGDVSSSGASQDDSNAQEKQTVDTSRECGDDSATVDTSDSGATSTEAETREEPMDAE